MDDSHMLNVGGHTLQLDYRGPNHTPGNLFIHAPQQRTLMLVDVIFPGWVPFDSLGQSSDIRAGLAPTRRSSATTSTPSSVAT